MISRRAVQRKKNKHPFRTLVRRAGALINAAPHIAGLEITDSAIRFVDVVGQEVRTTSLKLPPGVIEGGRLKDGQLFTEALKSLRGQIGRKDSIHVVMSLPPAVTYTQVFSIPVVARSKIDEAAQLNLQMISPIDISEAYYGYQLLGEAPVAGGQLELLGAFAESAIVDEFTKGLTAAQFTPVIVEFPALSLARLVKQQGLLEGKDSYLAVHITNDGVSLVILQKGMVYFTHFTYWQTIEQEGGFSTFLEREIKRVVSFYVNRCQCVLDELIIVSYTMDQNISASIMEALPDMNVRSLSIGEFPDILPIWFVAFGASLRGSMQRFKDMDITLTPLGAEAGYFQSLTLNFIRIWRNIFVGSLALLIVSFFVADAFLAQFSSSLSRDVAAPQFTEGNEAEELTREAEAFNALLVQVASIQESIPRWSPIFENVYALSRRNSIDLTRLSQNGGSLLVLGSASDEELILDFKNAINADPEFSNVSLPLTSIVVSADGSFSFTMTFDIVSAESDEADA